MGLGRRFPRCIPLTQGIHALEVTRSPPLSCPANMMIILKHQSWKAWGQMRVARIISTSLTRKHHSLGLPALPVRTLEITFLLLSFSVKMGSGGSSRVPFPLPSSQRSAAANRGLNKMVSSSRFSFQALPPPKTIFFFHMIQPKVGPDKNVNASWSKDKRWWRGSLEASEVPLPPVVIWPSAQAPATSL